MLFILLRCHINKLKIEGSISQKLLFIASLYIFVNIIKISEFVEFGNFAYLMTSFVNILKTYVANKTTIHESFAILPSVFIIRHRFVVFNFVYFGAWIIKELVTQIKFINENELKSKHLKVNNSIFVQFLVTGCLILNKK